MRLNFYHATESDKRKLNRRVSTSWPQENSRKILKNFPTKLCMSKNESFVSKKRKMVLLKLRWLKIFWEFFFSFPELYSSRRADWVSSGKKTRQGSLQSGSSIFKRIILVARHYAAFSTFWSGWRSGFRLCSFRCSPQFYENRLITSNSVLKITSFRKSSNSCQNHVMSLLSSWGIYCQFWRLIIYQ